jgi:competence protein ComEC
VVPALRALGVGRLDVLVVSHGDADHRGGAPAVLSALRVDRVWLPRGGREDPSFDTVRRAAAARGVAVEERGAGSLPESVGDLWLVPLWPPAGGVLSRNDRSLVLRIDLAGRRVLLPGDVEAAAEAALLRDPARLRADVLKLPHHGSRTSSSPSFLAAAEPLVAIASAPRFGRFGMPHPEVRARVRDAGAALWWTGRDGAVLVGVAPRLWVRGWRPWRSRVPAGTQTPREPQ